MHQSQYRLLKLFLLDKNINSEITQAVKGSIEADSDNRVSDIHVWKVGPLGYSATISIVTHFPKNPEHYKNLLRDFRELSHVTIEVNHCEEEPCIKPNMKSTQKL